MRNAALAEWTLSFVTSRERAAATIGDLLEEGFGPLAFWGSIAWTALSLVWRDLSAAPLGMLALGAYGLAIAIILSAFQGVAVAGLIVLLFPRAEWPLSVNHVMVTSLILGWAGSFIAGNLVARRALDREVAACFAVMILEAVVTLALMGYQSPSRPAGWYSGPLGSAFIYLFGQLFLLLGAARVRHRRLRHA